jgi:hypothetical protein
VSYLLQVRAKEREALAIQGLAPHVDEGTHLPTAAEVIEEFDQWLMADPEDSEPATRADRDQAELYALLGVGRRR